MHWTPVPASSGVRIAHQVESFVITKTEIAAGRVIRDVSEITGRADRERPSRTEGDDPVYRPATRDVVQRSGRCVLLTLAKRQLVDPSRREDLRNIRGGGALVLLQIVGMLYAAPFYSVPPRATKIQRL